MTIEEELQNVRPRRRVDAVNYSVLADIDQQLADAAAKIQERSNPYRRVSLDLTEEDRAKGFIDKQNDVLKEGWSPPTEQEIGLMKSSLLDPILAARNAITGTTPRVTAAPKPATQRLFKSGNDVISIDPVSGESTVAYQGAPRQDNTLRNYEISRIRDRARQLESIRNDGFKKAALGLQDDAIDAELAALDMKAKSLLAPPMETPTPAAPAAPPRPTPMMAIGDINQPLSEIGAPPRQGIVTPGQRGNQVTPSAKSIDYLMRNPDSAAQFDAKFGRGSAERYLRQ